LRGTAINSGGCSIAEGCLQVCEGMPGSTWVLHCRYDKITLPYKSAERGTPTCDVTPTSDEWRTSRCAAGVRVLVPIIRLVTAQGSI
jgi:hypothetical protein